jgi:hypothetical protein
VAGSVALAATTAGTLVLGIFTYLIYSAATLAQMGTFPVPPNS